MAIGIFDRAARREGMKILNGNGHAEAQALAPTPPIDDFSDGVQTIPLTSIVPSPLNPRKHFDNAKLEELAVSIRQKGVLQPILVRSHPDRGARPAYEVVAGERRLRAAGLAGLRVIPAIVRHLSDKDALEVMVVENEQREDVTALEKADGYTALVEGHHVTIEDLAARVGKSVSTIRNLLKLRQLPEQAREALEAGTLSPSVASLIARVPTAFYRERVAALIVHGCDWYNAKTFLDPAVDVAKEAKRSGDQGPATYQQAKEMISRLCMVELKSAPFSRKALDLVPFAKSCDDCPKRVGNLQKVDPEYASTRADVCTDPECYRGKVVAWQVKVEHEAKEKGQKILSEKDCKNLFDWNGRLAYGANYVDLAAQCQEDRKSKRPRSWKQLLDGHVEEKDIALAYDEEGRPHRLVPLDVARKIVKREHGLSISKAPARSGGDAQFRAHQAKHRRQQEIDKEIDRRVMGLVAEAAANIAEKACPMTGTAVTLFRHLVYDCVAGVWDDVCRQIKIRRGLQAAKGTGNRDVVLAQVEQMEVADLFGLLAEVAAARKAGVAYRDDDQDGEFFKFLKIDELAVQQQVEAEFAARAAEKGKGKKKDKRLIEVFSETDE